MSLLRRTQELFTSIFSDLKTVKFGKTNIRPQNSNEKYVYCRFSYVVQILLL